MTPARAIIAGTFTAPTATSKNEAPATSHAIQAVMTAEIADGSFVTRVMEQRADGRTTVTQARTLEGGQLVDARGREDRGPNPLCGGRGVFHQVLSAEQDHEDSHAERGLRDHVAAEELRDGAHAFGPRRARRPPPSLSPAPPPLPKLFVPENSASQ